MTEGYCVDLGCGDGNLAYELAKQSELFVVAIDADRANVASARAKLAAAGLYLDGAKDVTVTGNSFSSVRPKAVNLEGEPSRRVIFAGNVLTDVESDHGELRESVVTGNLEP